MADARVIAHADMDAFFAAVEQRDDPRLRGKPLLVGHPGGRGVVCTASYEARPFGVGSAMSMQKALRLCPQAIVVPPRFDAYAKVSRQVMEVFEHFSPRVEALSLDEAFLDLTGSERLLGDPARVGRAIKDGVREATALTVSVGVSATKYVAKVASDHHKPDGLTIVPADRVRAFLAPLPVRKLWGVGPKTAERLEAMGLRHLSDLQVASGSFLVSRLGPTGAHLRDLSLGIDPREVIPDREAKSVGAEHTLPEDATGAAAIRPHLIHAADEIAARLRKHGIRARSLRVKLKTHDFRLITRQAPLPAPADSAAPLIAAAERLLPQFPLDVPMRLVGLAAFDLLAADAPVQGDLFADPPRRGALDRALDAVQAKFGGKALVRASELGQVRPSKEPKPR